MNIPVTKHYTDGRRWSYINKAWIFESSWNQSEEIAYLKADRDEWIARVAVRDNDIKLLNYLIDMQAKELLELKV